MKPSMITITGNRKIIAQFLGVELTPSAEAPINFINDYQTDYPHPIKNYIGKKVAFIAALLGLLMAVAGIYFNGVIGAIVGPGLLLLLLFIFSFTKKYSYPNQYFPIWALLVFGVLGAGVGVGVYFYPQFLIPNFSLVASLSKSGAINAEYAESANHSLLLVKIILVSITGLGLVFALILGRRTFLSLLAPLFGVSGLLVFGFLLNLAITKTSILEGYANSGKPFSLVAVIFILIGLGVYDVVLPLLARFFYGGYQLGGKS